MLDRLADLGGAGLEVAGLGDRQPRPEQQLVAGRRQLGRLAVELAGVVRTAGGQQLVAGAREVVRALEREQAAQLVERRVVVLDAQVDSAPPGLTVGRHDHHRGGLAPADVAALALGGVEGRQQAVGEQAGGAAKASDIACGTVSRAIMFAWQLWR